MAGVTAIRGNEFLSELPNEILTSIFEYLKHEYSQHERTDSFNDHAVYCKRRMTSLYRLCLCSKHISEVAQPILYSEFQQSDEHPDQDIKFLRSILHRPDLATHIKRLDLLVKLKPRSTQPPKLDTRDVAKLGNEINVFNGRPSLFKVSWVADASHGYKDAVAAAILIFATGIQSLSLEFINHLQNERFQSRYLMRILDVIIPRQGTTLASSMAQVQELQLTSKFGYEDAFKRGFSEICAWFYSLTGLKKLTITGEGMKWIDDSFVSTVPELEIRIDRMNTMGLFDFLPCFKELEHLKLKGDDLDFDDVCESLATALSTLRSLCLKDVLFRTNHFEIPLHSFLGFSHLFRLESLDLNARSTCFYACQYDSRPEIVNRLIHSFPHNLNQLTLRRCNKVTVLHAFILLELTQERFSSLERLYLDTDEADLFDDENYTYEKLQELSEKFGVGVVVTLSEEWLTEEMLNGCSDRTVRRWIR